MKKIIFGKDCEFGAYTHIVAKNNVKIGDNVFTSPKFFASDRNCDSYFGMDISNAGISPRKRELVNGNLMIGNSS